MSSHELREGPIGTTLKYCFLVGLGAILFGLDQGCISGFLAVPQFNKAFGTFDAVTHSYAISATDQALLYGILLAGVVVGCIISAPIGSRYGRRVGLALCAIASIVGPIIQLSSTIIGVAIAGRFISGLGIGFAANFCIMYWAETTPARYRGMIVMMYQGFINLSQFVGACVNQGTHALTSTWAWRGPLIIMLGAPIVLLIAVPFLPDTPRWFIQKGRADAAHESLRKIRGPAWSEESIVAEIKEIAAMDQIECEIEASSSYLDCFQGTDHRRTRITILTLVVQQFTGISFITAYGTYFFSVSGVSDPFVTTVITSICGLLGSLAAFPLVKYFGRRPLLLVGGAGCAVSMLIFAIVGVADSESTAAARCLVAFTCTYIFSYGATWGPVPQAVIGEIPSNRLRSKTVSIATTINWLCTTFIICGSPYLLSDAYVNLGAKMGFIFGACSVVGLVWLWFELPETKDRTLEQIDEMFLNGVASRDFKSYVCTGKAGEFSVEEFGKRWLEKTAISAEHAEVAA